MREAAALAARGEPHGTVVVAETQTGGMGRHGHSWHSESTGGLYLSIVLRMDLPAESLPALTMALGLAAQNAVDDLAGVLCDLRWPNDLLLNEKKIAGILVQTAEPQTLIAGIGINVNQAGFPEELRSIATSIRIETGREYSKEALLERVVAESLRYAEMLDRHGKGRILEQFRARSSYVWGKSVRVEAADREIAGITAGLDDHGFLRVRTAEGMETIMSGGVRPGD